MSLRTLLVAVVFALFVASCDLEPIPPGTADGVVSGVTGELIESPHARPDWLGTRVLPITAAGHGEIRPTPPELVNREFETLDLLPPPTTTAYQATISEVPADVLARSTWHSGCPVALSDLRYLTVSHWGFDGRLHTGEIIVNRSVATDVANVFGALHDAEYPIEQLRVVTPEVMAGWQNAPTGDYNESGGFECRRATGSGSWSRHAFGMAIDLNPFHNPYIKGGVILPELASAYVDRSVAKPGMILPNDAVVQAFASVGWGWGGNWFTLKDYTHFDRR